MGEIDEMAEIETSPLEYVIDLGTKGSHILFDNDRIRAAFINGGDQFHDLDAGTMIEVREAVSRVLLIPEVEAKRDYISGLSPVVQDALIHLYFQMIEKTMLLNHRRTH